MRVDILPPPPPQAWRNQPPRYGETARHFKHIPTRRLVAELQKRWGDYPDEAACKVRERGEYSLTTFLVALHERADRSVFNAAKALVSSKNRRHRMQGFHILREMGKPGKRPVFPETWDLLENCLEEEKDPIVLHWILGCLGWTCSERAYPTLLKYLRHPNAWVRGKVANNLLACAPDIHDPRALKALLLLCNDKSSAVRWDALYEVKEYLLSNRPGIHGMLVRRMKDPNPHVRKLAKEAIHQLSRRARRPEPNAS